ncbi:DUF4148 domain-containing protein [Burkholderia sp. Bp8963]|uniref:DUF4148 domain-containing protein n=1 Tax=Burkholderia sp. Bp8963 TaxID=2184547 RepID=UPI000F5A5F82|nr:DUF4148 domain-containing protein [Burkholderia sp. Bp8963]RQS68476.1 DUF4148 domain-containing protein [Burkholderia sp. Bp8963]
MKSLVRAIALALTISAPLAAHAQSNQPLTRAQVHAEVLALKKAGFQPSDWFYPASILAAEAKVAQQKNPSQADGSGYGSAHGAATESGQ